MKKLIVLLVSILMLLSLSACGEKKPAAGGGTMVIYQNKSEVTAPMQAYADKWGAENNVKVTIKTCTGECDYGAGMKADINAGEAPDIFIIEGESGYNLYKDFMAPLTNEPWTKFTQYAFAKDGVVYGYPVAVEGWGLAYNKDILTKAGIDPEKLTTYSAYKAAFEKLDSMKKELGLTAVVSMTAADGAYWVTGNHDFAAYLSAGLDSSDRTVLNDVLAGKVDKERLTNYANWVKLIFDYTDEKMLTVGNVTQQMVEFGAGKYAFMHQGTWAEQNVKQGGGEFEMGFAPYATLGEKESKGLFVGAPSYYCVNKDSKNLDLAKKFLNDLCQSDDGQKMVVNEINLVPAFTNNAYKPSTKLASFLAKWVADGKPAFSFTNQYSTPDGFNMNTLGPIYNQLALKKIDQAKFEQLFTDAIATLAKK